MKQTLKRKANKHAAKSKSMISGKNQNKPTRKPRMPSRKPRTTQKPSTTRKPKKPIKSKKSAKVAPKMFRSLRLKKPKKPKKETTTQKDKE